MNRTHFGIAIFCALSLIGADAHAQTWKPSPGHTQTPIWPGTPPDAQQNPKPESVVTTSHLVAGRHYMAVLNVSRPTMTIYPAMEKNTGAAVVVLPGGGFNSLAIDLEGTETCDWLTAKGITCVLLKYRVPSTPYDAHCDCYPDDFATSTPSLEDLQRTMGLVRLHAREWHIDPRKIGVLGFSAGGYLAAEISTGYRQRLYAPIDEADKESARPDFAVLVYPGHLAPKDDRLNPNVPVSRDTPPTFIVQAENATVDPVRQSLVYYTALAKAGVPAELHIYAKGGHAFGLRPTADPVTRWPALAETWFATIGVTALSTGGSPHFSDH